MIQNAFCSTNTKTDMAVVAKNYMEINKFGIIGQHVQNIRNPANLSKSTTHIERPSII